MMEGMELDAAEATRIVRAYFQEQSGPVGVLFFRVESVKPNSKEDVYIVRCSFYPAPGTPQPTRYEVKVNTKTKNIIDVQELKE
ncbi:MAG: hypothetical protein ACE5FT_03795 [Candidatus Nanoarchaeia archaeon]